MGTALLQAQPAPPLPPAGVSVTNAVAPAIPGIAATNSLGPRIKFATPVADFGLVKNGETVKYTYIFTNMGDQVLTLANVAPGCGCTTAGNWTKTVEPGDTGSIPIQLQTVNFNGPIVKFVTVTCNDKTQASIMLQLKGTVWRPVDVIPPFANFTVLSDAPVGFAVLTITNRTEEPLFLFPPQCNKAAFAAELRTNAPGKTYELTVRMVPPVSPGIVQGQITIKTSFTNPPALSIPVWVNVQAPLLVMPQQIMLPRAPLAAKQVLNISIQNFTTNALALSDPAVDAKSVDVQIRELVPGRNFNVLLTFPEGFEIVQGQQAEFSVKSSLPKFPVIKVPITQTPRAAQVPAPAASPASPSQPAAKQAIPPALPLPSRAVAQ